MAEWVIQLKATIIECAGVYELVTWEVTKIGDTDAEERKTAWNM
jgi:hypothetical protein